MLIDPRNSYRHLWVIPISVNPTAQKRSLSDSSDRVDRLIALEAPWYHQHIRTHRDFSRFRLSGCRSGWQKQIIHLCSEVGCSYGAPHTIVDISRAPIYSRSPFQTWLVLMLLESRPIGYLWHVPAVIFPPSWSKDMLHGSCHNCIEHELAVLSP
jgi:hypothetical protein